MPVKVPSVDQLNAALYSGDAQWIAVSNTKLSDGDGAVQLPPGIYLAWCDKQTAFLQGGSDVVAPDVPSGTDVGPYILPAGGQLFPVLVVAGVDWFDAFTTVSTESGFLVLMPLGLAV